jgi:hypothetical protein
MKRYCDAKFNTSERERERNTGQRGNSGPFAISMSRAALQV